MDGIGGSPCPTRVLEVETHRQRWYPGTPYGPAAPLHAQVSGGSATFPSAARVAHTPSRSGPRRRCHAVYGNGGCIRDVAVALLGTRRRQCRYWYRHAEATGGGEHYRDVREQFGTPYGLVGRADVSRARTPRHRRHR